MGKAKLLIGVVPALLVFASVTANGWIGPQADPPPLFGEVVAQGFGRSAVEPDITYTVPTTGVVQLESYDNDPKCGPDGTPEDGHIFFLNQDPEVPPASTSPSCDVEPKDNLYSYAQFDVKPGDIISGDTRKDSGRLTISFAASEAPAAACVDIATDPELPETLPSNGLQVTLYVDAINPQFYRVVWTGGSQTFDSQPFEFVIMPNTTYFIEVAQGSERCELLGIAPTAEEPVDQPLSPAASECLITSCIYLPNVNR